MVVTINNSQEAARIGREFWFRRGTTLSYRRAGGPECSIHVHQVPVVDPIAMGQEQFDDPGLGVLRRRPGRRLERTPLPGLHPQQECAQPIFVPRGAQQLDGVVRGNVQEPAHDAPDSRNLDARELVAFAVLAGAGPEEPPEVRRLDGIGQGLQLPMDVADRIPALGRIGCAVV